MKNQTQGGTDYIQNSETNQIQRPIIKSLLILLELSIKRDVTYESRRICHLNKISIITNPLFE